MKRTFCVTTIILLLFGVGTASAVRNDIVTVIGDLGYYGELGWWDYCPPGSYAKEFSLKVEEPLHGSGDDTGVNGICLFCYKPNGNEPVKTIKSNEGKFGKWHVNMKKGDVWKAGGFCSDAFLTAVQFKQEQPQGSKDDTGTNGVRFKCKGALISATDRVVDEKATHKLASQGSKKTIYKRYTLGTPWGYWGPILRCPAGTAICGIQTRVESPQGDGDDTGLNGANFACCKVTK